jgi:hypothetical protein
MCLMVFLMDYLIGCTKIAVPTYRNAPFLANFA